MNKETLFALIRFFVPLIVAAGGAFGITLDPNIVLIVLVILAAFAAFFYCWFWRNNNFTKAAQVAQGVLDSLKDGTFADFKKIEEAVNADEPGGVEITDGD